MSATTIRPSQTSVKDPTASRVYQWDWTAELGDADVSTSTWAIDGDDAVLTKDNESIVAGNKKTKVRLIAGTLGKTYRVTNTITTNGSPVEIEPRSIFVKIEVQ